MRAHYTQSSYARRRQVIAPLASGVWMRGVVLSVALPGQ